ncbi:hypothetical protein BGZ82_004044, partial [Podila clonocystis]
MAEQSAVAIDSISLNGIQEKGMNQITDSMQQQQDSKNQTLNKNSRGLDFKAALTNNLRPRLTRDQVRAGFKQLDDNATTNDWNNLNMECNIVFTHIPDKFVVGIPYDKTSAPVNEVAEAIHAVFPSPKAVGLDMHTRGVAFLIFQNEHDRQEALAQKTIAFSPSPLSIFPTLLSKGRKVTIRTDYIPIHIIEERRECLQALFGPYGKIIHITSHHHAISRLNNQATTFILEVQKDAPEDLMIPRVAAIKGCNVLFSWTGAQFCFRCGLSDHIKIQCPLPMSFDFSKEEALEAPIMARAFPDPHAPLRKVPKKSEATVSLAKTAASNDLLLDGFQTQRS